MRTEGLQQQQQRRRRRRRPGNGRSAAADARNHGVANWLSAISDCTASGRCSLDTQQHSLSCFDTRTPREASTDESQRDRNAITAASTPAFSVRGVPRCRIWSMAATGVLGVGIEESLWTIFKSLTLVLCLSPCSHHWSMGKLQRFVIGTVRDCVDYVGSCERNRLRICCTFLTLSGACRTPQLAGEQRRGSTLGPGGAGGTGPSKSWLGPQI